jgi:hypothetical protein
MAISTTNYVQFSYIKETVPGETPATPQFQKIPVKSVGLSDNITTSTSEVIRDDRQTDDLTIVDAEVSGDCNYELSYSPFKPLIVSLLQGGALISVSEAGSDVTVAQTGSTYTSAATINFGTSGLLPGMKVRVAGFTDPANNGIKTVVTATAGVLTVEETLADEAAGDSVTFDVECVRNGAETMDTYTFKKKINAPGATNAFFYYRGCAINKMSFDFATGAILTGAMGLIGRTAEARTSDLTGEQTPLEVPSYRIMNSVSSITSITATGLPTTAEFSNLNLTIDNQAKAAKAIGTLGAADIAPLSLQVTGDIELYFEDLSLYNIYKAATEFALSFTLEDATASQNIMVIDLPKCKFNELSEPVDGKDAFLMESGSLTALRDATNNYTVQFSFFDAV